MESSFITWMDRYNLEYPNQLQPDNTDEFVKIQQNKGDKHEKNFLEKLQNVTIIARDNDSYINTKNAMNLQNNKIIYQAHLKSNNQTKDPTQFSGYADFLFQVDGNSNLGTWHYEPWDTKLALKPKPYFIVQLCCYAEMLESTQGKKPKSIHVVFGNNSEQSFDLENYFYYYQQLKTAFLNQQENFNPLQRPPIDGLQNYGRWTSQAETILTEQNHLSLVANITKSQIKKLIKHGILTLKELAFFNGKKPDEITSSTFITLKKQAQLQLQSIGKEKPEYEIITQKSELAKTGLFQLPPGSNDDIYFDIEGYPFIEGGKKLEYLFGLIYIEKENTAFKDWWAHNHYQEKKIFTECINWIYSRWKKNPKMHIYHYGDYEPTTLKRLMGEHGICEDKIDVLLRNEVFIDLYKIVKQSLLIGEPNYSLKNIERLYKNERKAKITKADESIIYYEKWLNQCGTENWEQSEELKKIRNYNKEDCLSTMHLCNFLRNIQEKENIPFIPKSSQPTKNNPLNDEISNTTNILLKELEQNNFLTESDRNLTEIFYYLLGFHQREEKPIWWKMFKHIEMTKEELFEDPDCLAGIINTDIPYIYKFNPIQETKLKKGDSCFYLDENDKKQYSKIKDINYETGMIVLDKSVSSNKKINLIPLDYVRTDVIRKSILNTVIEWKKNKKIHKPIKDFLLKKHPTITGILDGQSIINPKKNFIQETTQAISNMDNTILSIQGPPGSGKTYTAAEVIVKLINDGKTVGISSNSHKAIDLLLKKVLIKGQKENATINPVKIGRSSKEKEILPIQYEDKVKNVFPNFNKYNLIGGTSWKFSNAAAKDQLDYLFVDEAGQVSTANLVGMAPSAKNIILIGDQAQLSCPIKGVHPKSSGLSCLEYILQEHQTVTDDFGIFLEKTHRLHPNICTFISTSFYENRLKHQSDNAKNYIITDDNKLITKDSGILFIPVKHEDNKQKSIEEASMIKALIEELLTLQYHTYDSNTNNTEIRNITLNDILIMAPYNMQIQEIKKNIPQAKVGTVDKFQGQEAPISIISMCTSNAHASPRGLSFVLSKNRLNVALSRAKTLAIVVGNPELTNTSCNTIKQIELVNLFCKITKEIQPIGFKNEI